MVQTNTRCVRVCSFVEDSNCRLVPPLLFHQQDFPLPFIISLTLTLPLSFDLSLQLSISKEATVAELKERIAEVANVPARKQKLLVKGTSPT